ncbi:hypothetical protein BJV82DRAFT_583927 [Fennellomyces sp. T-0311]|nr:hypothetical protein BJV82DRAFT_583927 [Fennellomyces sp. T-0311]
MANLIADNGIEIAKVALAFLEEKADDWKQVIPEAHDFKRECEHFLYIIDALHREEKKKAPPPKKTSKAAAFFRMAIVARAFSQNLTKKEGDDDARPIGGDIEERVLLDSESGVVIRQENRELVKKKKEEEEEQVRGVHGIVKEIVGHIRDALKHLEKFLKENERKKSWQNSVRWFFKRALVARDYRDFMKGESNAIRGLLNDLVLCQKIADKAISPKVDSFEKDMTEDTYLFWKKHIGQTVVARWDQFIDAYRLLYGMVDACDLEYMERMLMSKKGDVTVYGFISFTRKHGFPFKKNIATASPQTEPVISEEGRMEITKMVITMVTDFSSPEMRDHLVNIYKWFKGIKRDNAEGLQQRANEWAHLVLAARAVDGEVTDKEQKKAQNVDAARRAINFFYQRYMVMWRIGQVSREALKDVDFPGKNRIKDFICFVGPLDYANYHIVIGKSKNWESNRPKVYLFLEKHLEVMEETKKREQRTVTSDDPPKDDNQNNSSGSSSSSSSGASKNEGNGGHHNRFKDAVNSLRIKGKHAA